MAKRIVKLIWATAFVLNLATGTHAQLPVPDDIGKTHPRCFGRNMSRDAVHRLVNEEAWAKHIVDEAKGRLSKYLSYCEKQPDWLQSRLQMCWKTKASQVYINGGIYDHAEGVAPYPTVKFIGGRGTKTDHRRPKLEDVLPYTDDPRGLYLERKDQDGKWEWVPIPATGSTVSSINHEILSIARDAAFLYWNTGDEAYAMLAYGVFDIYMTGIFHAKEPIDLSRGHHQTLVGYTQFEVIQEHYIAEVTQIYDFLFDYISRKHNDRLPVYVTSLQKWADQFIKNGVSFNNWNIFQASHVARIALVLENNSAYENGKGAQYYLDQIMNQTSTRQWSMIKLLEYGYEQETGIWNESPGYSLGVLRDLVHLIKFYDHSFGIDLIEKLPVLKKAVLSSAQYLNPNLTRITFGDGHYGKLDPGPVLYMIENAQKYGRMEDEIIFTKMLKTLFDDSEYRASKGKKIDDLFQEKPLKVREDIVAGKLSDFTSPLFYAPNVSWLVQRQGELMISQIGSMGNHMHSNGIAMQLYGYGLPLAPEPGHGSSYFSIEYGEYYTQFPAHNTVIVNGKSKYPEMKSNHAFTLNASYPKSGVQNGIFPRMTFSDVSFLEPETHSDQRRVMGIVTDVEGGYYIDIFRSKQKEGKDVKHEYCYHNLGQSLELKDEDGNILPMNPTTKMAFGDGDLMAYDYMWEKKSIESSNNFTGQFNLHLQDKAVSMNLWSRGEKNREIFTALSPKATSLAHGILPDKLQELPIPTVVIRQNGEAWSNPFVLVYEPALNGTSNIMRVDYFGDEVYTGIHIVNKSGREEFIFSSPVKIQMKKDDKIVEGSYAIVSIQGNDVTLFLGNGKSIANSGYRVESEKAGHFAFEKRGDVYVLLAQHPITLTIPVENLYNSYMMTIAGKAYKGVVNKKTKAVRFDLPAVEYQNVNFVTQAR